MLRSQDVRREVSVRIRDRESQLAKVPALTEVLPRLRALHEQFARTPVGQMVDDLASQGKDAELRDLVTLLVHFAVLDKRQPEVRSTWLRVKVAWTEDVQALIDAGLLTLDPEPQPPVLDPKVAARWATQARYRAHTRRASSRAGALA